MKNIKAKLTNETVSIILMMKNENFGLQTFDINWRLDFVYTTWNLHKEHLPNLCMLEISTPQPIFYLYQPLCR